MRLPIATFYQANAANYTKGRQGNSVDRITVHHTAGMESSLRSLYENPKRQGSAHFFVHPDKIEQYVDTKDTAWTNGNFSSNLRAITIETRGDWRGYYDQKTIDMLRRLFTELRKMHPNARLTYHMDESNKATACPADLKHKGYALKAWNESVQITQSTNQGGSEVANAAQVNNIYKAVLHREGDAGGIKNYTGKDANVIVADMLNSAEFKAHQNFINTASAAIADQKATIEALSARPTKEQLSKAIADLESSRQALAQAETKVVEVVKEVIVEKQVDEKTVVTNVLKRFWDSLFKK